MKTVITPILTVCLALAVLVEPAALWAQADEDQERTRERRQWNPEEAQQRMAERLQNALDMDAEEWTAIQPLVQNVLTKQREAGLGRGGMRGRGGRGGGERAERGPRGEGGEGREAGRGPRGGSEEMQQLRAALASESTSAGEIEALLEAVRAQREQARAELEEARDQLREVLTVRQEAVLVTIGILD